MAGVRVAVGLGANEGDRAANLRSGLRGISRLMDDVRASSIYETVPEDRFDQPMFLNACCVGRTKLSPGKLLDGLHRLELQAGRTPGGARYGPRPLDLDLLLYGGAVIRDRSLSVPHPRLRERAFVLVPLAELCPECVVPAADDVEAATVGELVARRDVSGVERTALEWEEQP